MLYDEVSATEMAAARITPALDAEGGTGATALLHGILASLSESLERLDRRLVALEGTTEERLARLEGRMEEGLGALTEALRAAAEADEVPEEPEEQPDLAAEVRALVRGEIERLGRGLQDEVERLGVLVRGQVAEVSGQAASMAAVLGRLDGRLHDLVEGVRVTAQSARALRRIDGEPEGVPETLSLS